MGPGRASPWANAWNASNGPEPLVIMVANSATPIHGRKWCVYEAFVADEQQLVVIVAGEQRVVVKDPEVLDAYLRGLDDASSATLEQHFRPKG